MCPFVPGSLQKQLLFGAVHEQSGLDIDAVKAIMLREMERFIALRPTAGNEAQFKSLLVIFPNLSENLIERAQAELAPHFVPNGLMVGEFHAGPPDKRGLWNEEFRPLYSPVPLLGIRHMVPTDILFLKGNAELFGEYVKIYGNAVPERFRAQFEEAAQQFGLSSTSGAACKQAAPRVMETLDAVSMTYRVHRHDDCPHRIRKPRDFARWLDYDIERITKTLFVKCRDGEHFYLLVCSINKRVDLQDLARRLDTKRLELASLSELKRHVGYPPTSVTPIAVNDIPVLMDESLMNLPTVLTGSGVPRIEIEIAPTELRSLCNAQLFAMT